LKFGGIKIVVVPDVPRYQLPADLPLPNGFREDFNAWARGFLGIQKPWLRDGQSVNTHGAIHMNPRTYEMVKHKLLQMEAMKGAL
jgi:hypothetical protein